VKHRRPEPGPVQWRALADVMCMITTERSFSVYTFYPAFWVSRVPNFRHQRGLFMADRIISGIPPQLLWHHSRGSVFTKHYMQRYGQFEWPSGVFMVMTQFWRQTWYQVYLNKRILVDGSWCYSMLVLYINISAALILSTFELNQSRIYSPPCYSH